MRDDIHNIHIQLPVHEANVQEAVGVLVVDEVDVHVNRQVMAGG